MSVPAELESRVLVRLQQQHLTPFIPVLLQLAKLLNAGLLLVVAAEIIAAG